MRRLFVATLLVSTGAIGYELLLMRTLSIVQWHHFAYMIISLALLGYGASGTFIALNRERLERRFTTAFAVSALLCSVAMAACYAIGQRLPFNALAIVWNPLQLAWLGLVYLVYFVPFFLAATCIGLALTFRREAGNRIYFFDLLGAGTGAALLIGLLFLLPPQDALVPLVTLPLAASFVMRRLVVAQALWLLVLAANLAQPAFELRISEYKGLSQALQVVDARVLQTTSSPLGLVTVVDSPTVPVRHAPGLSFNTRHVPPAQLAVFTDGDGLSAITRFSGDFADVRYLADLTAALPYALREAPDVLVVGAGGGTDVLLALQQGAAHVDAVELDPQVTRLVRDTFADFAGHLYDDPRVTVHTGEARGFVRRSAARYDLVHIGLLDSFAAAGAGVQALNENTLYTIEALRAFLASLEPDGIIAITRWLKLPPRDSVKLVATAIEALRGAGVGDPGSQLAAIRSWNTSTLLIRNGPFTRAEIDALRAFAQSHSFDTAWYPGMPAANANRYNRLDAAYLYEASVALLGDDAGRFLADYAFHVAPATDDRPFFFHFFRWASLPSVLALRPVGGAGQVEWGYLVLVATLAQAVLAGLVLILLPLARTRRDWPAGTAPRMGAYFLLLGLAFLFIEIAFIHRFVLFLSHPLYSVAVVLSGFLVFAGIGSALSRRLTARLGRARGIQVVVATIAALSLLYVVVLPWIFDAFGGFPDAARILISLALIAPLGLAMGMPFPLGLARLGVDAPGFIPWAWGINGFASVVSAVLATLLAIEFGFRAVIVLALLLYAAAAAILVSLQPARGRAAVLPP